MIQGWLANTSGARTNTAGAFASSWGHDSVSCSVGNSCSMPSGCSNYNKEEGSGQAHLIMKSLQNLHDVSIPEGLSRTLPS